MFNVFKFAFPSAVQGPLGASFPGIFPLGLLFCGEYYNDRCRMYKCPQLNHEEKSITVKNVTQSISGLDTRYPNFPMILLYLNGCALISFTFIVVSGSNIKPSVCGVATIVNSFISKSSRHVMQFDHNEDNDGVPNFEEQKLGYLGTSFATD